VEKLRQLTRTFSSFIDSLFRLVSAIHHSCIFLVLVKFVWTLQKNLAAHSVEVSGANPVHEERVLPEAVGIRRRVTSPSFALSASSLERGRTSSVLGLHLSGFGVNRELTLLGPGGQWLIDRGSCNPMAPETKLDRAPSAPDSSFAFRILRFGDRKFSPEA